MRDLDIIYISYLSIYQYYSYKLVFITTQAATGDIIELALSMASLFVDKIT